MTMPTRPAPAPPRLKGHNAAVNANVTLQQLHLLQQHQQQQQQQLEQRSQQYNVTVPKLTIKLPPPPMKGQISLKHNHRNNNNDNIENNVNNVSMNGNLNQSVLPQARYTPTTDWNDAPFENFFNGKMHPRNSNDLNRVHKKVPPPRPPPPRCNNSSVGSTGYDGASKKIPIPLATIQQSTNVLNNLFHRKKSTATTNRPSVANSTASRIYNSATYGGNTRNEIKQIQFQQHNSNKQQLQQNTTAVTANLDSAWNSSTNALIVQSKEPQLISFDSPPSSPTFTQKSNSDCLSVDSFSSDSNFSSPNYGGASQPESGFEDDFNSTVRSRPATTSPRDPWDTIEVLTTQSNQPAASVGAGVATEGRYGNTGSGNVRNLNIINARIQNSDDNPLCNGKSLIPPAPPLNVPTIIKPKISQKPKAPKPPPILNSLPQTKSIEHVNINSTNLNNKWLSAPRSLSLSTSIPTCTVSSVRNPEISILDVITGKVDALQLDSSNTNDARNSLTATTTQPYGISMYPFDGNEDGDLCFRENEKIYLVEQINADWLKGRTRAGCEGIFPANYIDIKVPLPPTRTNDSVSKVMSNNIRGDSDILQARCLYNFPAEVDGDLELKENDVVTILYRINADWLYGELNGNQGQFPANFLENVPTNIPTL